MTNQIDTAVVLGGGIFPEGSLTNLSKQRLDKAVDAYNVGLVTRIVVLGEQKSTYFDTAITYDIAGAVKRRAYLVDQGVAAKDVIMIEKGRDTIGEAIACKHYLPTDVHAFYLITSTLHMPRALWIFQTAIGTGCDILPLDVDCQGLLILSEEAEYLRTTKDYYANHPDLFQNETEARFQEHRDLYDRYAIIHDKYHPPGQESEAYCAVKAPS